ncbi:hypothetical protein SDC49_15685 [Lactobacillus sp. R2/2]|nr:hypothetical protein [Lactobacillus sp. R2/2]
MTTMKILLRMIHADDIDSAEIAMVINRINKFAEENLLVYDKVFD